MSFDQKVSFGVILFLSMMCIVLGIMVYDKARYIEYYETENEFYKDSYKYISEGAIRRGYMDLCVSIRGKEGVWFKDECMRIER